MLTNRTRSGRVLPPDGMVSALQVSDLDSVYERLRNFLPQLTPAQNHLLNGWNELTEQDRLRLAREIDSIDFRTLSLHRCHRPVLGLWSGKNFQEQSVQQAVKYERFIFDLLPLAQSSLLINAERSSVFAPVKTNDREGIDTPERARTMMQSVYRRWFAERGVTIPQARPVEISPLFSVDSRQFRRQPVPAFGPGPIYVEANRAR